MEDSTAWNSWFTGVTFTDAVFGPTSPTIVREDSTYYFRVKAYDLATNVETTHVKYDQKVHYVPVAVAFKVYNPYYYADSALWKADTYDVGQTVSMNDDDILIVKNLGNDTLLLAMRGFPVAWDTLHHRPVWHLKDFQGPDTFAIRAKFTDEPTSPSTFTITDALRDTFIYAYNGYYGGPAQGKLGPYGGGEADSVSFTENLWMRILLPTTVSEHGDTTVYRFTVQLKARRIAP